VGLGRASERLWPKAHAPACRPDLDVGQGWEDDGMAIKNQFAWCGVCGRMNLFMQKCSCGAKTDSRKVAASLT
jgi:hypothetical protein